jgi:hypothetical protein
VLGVTHTRIDDCEVRVSIVISCSSFVVRILDMKSFLVLVVFMRLKATTLGLRTVEGERTHT